MTPIGIFKKSDDPEEILNQIAQLLALHECALGTRDGIMVLGKVTDDIKRARVIAEVILIHPRAIDWRPVTGEMVSTIQ